MFDRLALRSSCGIAGAVAAIAIATGPATAEIKVHKTEHGATITVAGGPFAEYLIKSGHQPVIWPITGPNGQLMTHPLGTKPPTDKNNHPHHQSLWFNHGLVNGKHFWTE